MSARTRAYFFLLLTAIIWGAASPVVKYSTQYIPPLIMLVYRFAISSLIALFFWPTIRRHLPKTTTDWIYTIIYGFLVTTVTLALFFIGVDQSSSIVAAMGSVFQPVIASLAGMYFLRERVTHREKAGLSVALVGSIIITFEPLLGNGHALGTFLGNLLLIASRLTDTASTLLAKTILRVKVSPVALTHVCFIIGFITIIPFVLVFHTPTEIVTTISHAPLGAHGGVFFMALLSGTLAYSLFHAAEKTIEVGEATVSYYLHPLFSAPLSFLWLKEPLTPGFVVGSAIVALGVIISGLKNHPRTSPSKLPLQKRSR